MEKPVQEEISLESSQGSTVCVLWFGTSCLISVGFSYSPCLSSGFFLGQSFSLTRKLGVAHELRYFKHGPDAYNGITSIIDSSSQISHQIWNSDGIQQCDTWEVFGSACQSALVL